MVEAELFELARTCETARPGADDGDVLRKTGHEEAVAARRRYRARTWVFPLARCVGPALYEPLEIANVSFGGSPPSTTIAVKVQPEPQAPVIVAVALTTVSDVIEVLVIAVPLAGSEYVSDPLTAAPFF
jgi:hypothetical protein